MKSRCNMPITTIPASRGTLLRVPLLAQSRGPDLPLLDLTISQALDRAAARHPDRDALIVRHQNARFTWRELNGAASRVAAGLAALGLTPGDRVGIWAVNCQ